MLIAVTSDYIAVGVGFVAFITDVIVTAIVVVAIVKTNRLWRKKLSRFNKEKQNFLRTFISKFNFVSSWVGKLLNKAEDEILFWTSELFLVGEGKRRRRSKTSVEYKTFVQTFCIFSFCCLSFCYCFNTDGGF